MTRIGFYALCATVLAGCGGNVRKEPKTQATIDFPVDLVFGVADESVQQELPENWKSKFQPPGGTMETNEDRVGFSFAFGLQPECRQYVGSGFTIGALVKYQLHYPGWIDEYVSQDTVEWWDPVIVQAIALRKSPSLGVLVASRAPQHQQFRAQVTAFYYSLVVMDFAGVNVPDEKNGSKPIHEEELGRGVGISVGLDFRPPWGSDNLGRFGVSVDVARAVRAFGVGWRFTIPIFESEDTISATD